LILAGNYGALIKIVFITKASGAPISNLVLASEFLCLTKRITIKWLEILLLVADAFKHFLVYSAH
jgi:hypothetical protein